MKITKAENRDIPGMIKLLKQVGQVHHEIRPDLFRGGAQKYSAEDLERMLKDATRPIFVAREEDDVLGYAFCIHQESYGDAVLVDGKTLYIDDLCVEEGKRNQHIGKALYEHVCGYAKSCGCRAVTLNVWCGNDSAMEFYYRRGMKPQKIGMEMILEESEC